MGIWDGLRIRFRRKEGKFAVILLQLKVCSKGEMHSLRESAVQSQHILAELSLQTNLGAELGGILQKVTAGHTID